MRLALGSRIAGCALLGLSLGVLAAGGAEAVESPYIVAKVTVDKTAKDAVAAKATGMAEAELNAFKIVLKRLVPSDAVAELPELNQEDVEGMVEGVSIRSEQNSTTRYIASLDVSFSEQAVKQYLQSSGVAFSETRAPSISIMPLVIAGGTVKGEGDEGWHHAWDDLDLAHSMTPATLLSPRPDLKLKTVKAVLAGDKEALALMQNDYGAPLVIAVGEADKGKFVTRLVGEDGAGEINFGRSDTFKGGDAKAAARDAASIAFEIIENRWKVTQGGEALPTEARYEEGGTAPGKEGAEGANAETPSAETPKGETPRNVVAMVEFSGLKDWQDIRARLMNVAGVQALEVNSLSARTASITFDYAGSLDRLEGELGQSGFSLEDREGTFVLRSR